MNRIRSRRLHFENLEGRELLAVAFDPYFGDGGKVLDFSGDAVAQDMAVQPDGKVVVVGKFSGGSLIAVARYKRSGDIDTAFGNQGHVVLNVPADTSSLAGVALQADGKIIVMGSLDNAGNADFLVARLLANGSLDSSFGGTGMVQTPIGTGDDLARSVAVQSDGRIVVVGNSEGGTGSDMAVVRYLPNGSLDPQFAGTGKKTFALGPGLNSANGVGIQPDGKIVVVGSAANNSNLLNVAVARLNANGNFDATFSGDGKLLVAFSTNGDSGQDLALQPDGKIVVVGGSGSDVAVARLRTNGKLDPTFSQDGKATAGITNSLCFATGAVLQDDGKLLVTSFNYNVVRTTATMFRFNVNGNLDASFDGDGKRLIRLGDSSSFNDIAVLPNGSILAAGNALASSESSFLLCKFVETRPVITSFIVPGRATLKQRVFLSATAIDPNQNSATLAYTWTITGPRGFKVTLKGRNVNFVASQKGTLTVSLVVTDQEGLTDRATAKIAVA
jgi:uncharacterized delta-60 repeat protein